VSIKKYLDNIILKTSFIFILLFILRTNSICQVYPDSEVNDYLKKGINAIILQEYSSANNIFTELNNKHHRLPLGKIYLAALQIAKSYDYGIEYNNSLIDSLLYSAKDQSKKLLDSDPNNKWNEYFLGLSEGYLAYFNAMDEDWISSFSEGVNALDDFNNVIKKDADFYDALIAIGTFKYWRSRKTEFLSWLPGYKDERKAGIKMLEEVAEHNSYNKYLAINSLIWINIDEKEYEKAAGLAESALKKYHGSRFFMWGLARAYEEINPEKSIKIYGNIITSLGEDLNNYNEVTLKHLMAQQYKKIGKKREALILCNEILSLNINEETEYPRLRKRLERVKELKMELSR
jgi:hypothetical protein